MATVKYFLGMLLLLTVYACSAQTSKETSATVSKNSIEAYYFHFNSRCTTCRTVETQTQVDIDILYPELVKSGAIRFTSVNLDEAEGKAIGKDLGVSGQTLLLVKGDKKINITNEGFMYAVKQPEKFKAVIKEKVDSLLGI